jgi:prepilin-type N-terminal cleavage/methylation domain-containing protein
MHSTLCRSLLPRTARRGFTLIELLTVIAIIGILAAIIIPTVGRVRASARMTTDLSNLRQIGVAAAGYVSENKGAMPYMVYNGSFLAGELNSTPSAGVPPRFPVYESLDRYFTKKSGFNASGQYQWQKRPQWFSASAVPPDGLYTDNSPYGGYVHFSFNPNIWSSSGQWRARMSNVPSPSRTVLAGETNDPAGVGDADFDPTTAVPANTGDVQTKYRISQPGNKALYLYADYHVQALVGNQNFATNPTLWRWW